MIQRYKPDAPARGQTPHQRNQSSNRFPAYLSHSRSTTPLYTPAHHHKQHTTNPQQPKLGHAPLGGAPYGIFFDLRRPTTLPELFPRTLASATRPTNPAKSKASRNPSPVSGGSGGVGSICPIEMRFFPITSSRHSATRSMYLECGFWQSLLPEPLKEEDSKKPAEAETTPLIMALTPASCT